MSGRDAVRLWYDHRSRGSAPALELMLAYNAEDVRNLAHIRRRLRVEQRRRSCRVRGCAFDTPSREYYNYSCLTFLVQTREYP